MENVYYFETLRDVTRFEKVEGIKFTHIYKLDEMDIVDIMDIGIEYNNNYACIK